jgi:hypothetical protein
LEVASPQQETKPKKFGPASKGRSLHLSRGRDHLTMDYLANESSNEILKIEKKIL